MGNICMYKYNCLNNTLIDFKHSFKHKEDPVRCVKCGDNFKIHWGGKSQRTSCRHHNWVKRDYEIIDGQVHTIVWCLTCNVPKSKHRTSNCYHNCYYD